MIFSRNFWIDALERAVKTFAQALAAVLVVGVPVWEVDWVQALGVAVMAMVLSVVSSVASLGVGGSDASLIIPPTAPSESGGV